MNRQIKRLAIGQAAIDGAGVHLFRVLGYRDTKDFDPFLMLDSFDSKNPDDYIKGFPFHPHRGIETITYLIEGAMEHQDSLGNKGTIQAGESQWMTAGSGIMHQEMPLATKHMLGLQIWLNLAAKDKMVAPQYLDIKQNMMGRLELPQGSIQVIAGDYRGTAGVTPRYHAITLYDVVVKCGQELTIETTTGDNVFIFLIEGSAIIEGQEIPEKTAVLFEMDGDCIVVTAPIKKTVRFIYFSGKPLQEPIAWGGPVVMNTAAELNNTFLELENGTFIK